MKEFFDRSGNCSLCEIRSKDTLISETPNFSTIVPFAASYPFEIWIIPRQHLSYFHEIDEDKVLTAFKSLVCFIFCIIMETSATIYFKVQSSLHICSYYTFGVPIKLWRNLCANSLKHLLLAIDLACMPNLGNWCPSLPLTLIQRSKFQDCVISISF